MELDIPDVTDGCLDKNMLKAAAQKKNEKDIKSRYLDNKNERDYIKKLNIRDTRVWFRLRNDNQEKIQQVIGLPRRH